MSDSFRSILYDRYASVVQGTDASFDEKAAREWGRAYDTFFRGWLPENKDASIFEVACGWGRLLLFFRERGYCNLKGVDISSEQVTIARQKFGCVEQGDAIERLESFPCAFDLIVGIDLIEHLTKDEALKFLEKCYRALKPGGRIILQTPNAESPWGMKIKYGDFTHENAYTPDALKKLLQLYGFSEIEYRAADPVVHGIKSFVRFWLWKLIRLALAFWNIVETGDAGSGVYTRVFFIAGIKEADCNLKQPVVQSSQKTS